MSMMNSMSRMRGQEKGPGYTQTETILGESMQRFGRELGEESNFGELQHIKAPHRKKKKHKRLFLYTSWEQSGIILFPQGRSNNVMKNAWVYFPDKMPEVCFVI